MNQYAKNIEHYKLGDKIGSTYEGMGLVNLTPTPYSKINFNHGTKTDETDLVECFDSFVNAYQFSNVDQFLLDWCIFLYNHRGVRKYGSTWKHFFLLMEELIETNRVGLSIINSIAKDHDRKGNGCLPLVYPVYHYANSIGQDPYEFTERITLLTHAHPEALKAVSSLVNFIHNATDNKEVFDAKNYGEELFDFLNNHIDLSDAEFAVLYPHNVTALNTLFYAMYCVKNTNNMEDLISKVVSFRGDTDSATALALLLHSIRHKGHSEVYVGR